MTLLTRLIDAIPLLLLSAGVIAMFNGLLQVLVLTSQPEARIALDLGGLTSVPILVDLAQTWPWLLAGGAGLFVGGMIQRR